MQHVKIMKDCYVSEDQVKLYCSYSSNPIKEKVRLLKKEGKVYDFTAGRKILTIIFLQSGEAILLNVSLETLHTRFNK